MKRSNKQEKKKIDYDVNNRNTTHAFLSICLPCLFKHFDFNMAYLNNKIPQEIKRIVRT
jgi:hypothetical protein